MENKKLKVIALSDTHGNLPKIKEEFGLSALKISPCEELSEFEVRIKKD